MRRLSSVLLSLILLALLVAGCGGAATPTNNTETSSEGTEATAAGPVIDLDEGEKLKVAFIYVAPIGDLGWTWAHNQGRKELEETFGDRIETTYVESVPEGPEGTRAIRDFAQQGYHVIFTTSFGYMDPTIEVAKEFPNTWFIHISGYKTAPNVSTVFGRMEAARYLSGIAAGSTTKSNSLGYVAAFPIPEVVRGINAFTLGARSVNPDATVNVVYTNTWFGPPEEREAAQALLDQGADVIAQHQDTTEPQKAAQEAGAFSVGYNTDMHSFVGDSVLTSPVWDWGSKYVDIIQQVLDGTYKSESYYGLEIVGLAPFSPTVDARIVDIVEAQDAAIRAGEADVFCGPIRSNTDVLVVAEGKCLTDAELLSMDWYVEGVVGDAPADAKEGLGEDSDKVPAALMTTNE